MPPPTPGRRSSAMRATAGSSPKRSAVHWMTMSLDFGRGEGGQNRAAARADLGLGGGVELAGGVEGGGHQQRRQAGGGGERCEDALHEGDPLGVRPAPCPVDEAERRGPVVLRQVRPACEPAGEDVGQRVAAARGRRLPHFVETVDENDEPCGEGRLARRVVGLRPVVEDVEELVGRALQRIVDIERSLQRGGRGERGRRTGEGAERHRLRDRGAAGAGELRPAKESGKARLRDDAVGRRLEPHEILFPHLERGEKIRPQRREGAASERKLESCRRRAFDERVEERALVERGDGLAIAVRRAPRLGIERSEEGEDLLHPEAQPLLQPLHAAERGDGGAVDPPRPHGRVSDEKVEFPDLPGGVPSQPQETVHEVERRRSQVHDGLPIDVAVVRRAVDRRTRGGAVHRRRVEEREHAAIVEPGPAHEEAYRHAARAGVEVPQRGLPGRVVLRSGRRDAGEVSRGDSERLGGDVGLRRGLGGCAAPARQRRHHLVARGAGEGQERPGARLPQVERGVQWRLRSAQHVVGGLAHVLRGGGELLGRPRGLEVERGVGRRHGMLKNLVDEIDDRDRHLRVRRVELDAHDVRPAGGKDVEHRPARRDGRLRPDEAQEIRKVRRRAVERQGGRAVAVVERAEQRFDVRHLGAELLDLRLRVGEVRDDGRVVLLEIEAELGELSDDAGIAALRPTEHVARVLRRGAARGQRPDHAGFAGADDVGGAEQALLH